MLTVLSIQYQLYTIGERQEFYQLALNTHYHTHTRTHNLLHQHIVFQKSSVNFQYAFPIQMKLGGTIKT